MFDYQTCMKLQKKCPDRKTKYMGHVYFAMLPDLTYPGICCRLTNTNRRSSTLLLSTRMNVRGAVGQIVGRDGQGRHLGGHGADPTILRLGKSILDERKAKKEKAARYVGYRDCYSWRKEWRPSRPYVPLYCVEWYLVPAVLVVY